MTRKIAIVAVLLAAIVIVASTAHPPKPAAATWRSLSGRPRLIDLGGGECMPCRMMEPVVGELRETYAGQLDVLYVDIHQDKAARERFSMRIIPLQVFEDGEGRELWRHEGFLSRADALAKWDELGYTFAPSDGGPTQEERAPGLLERLFTGLGAALSRSPAIALTAALVWGVLSVLLSPCHLASIPLIVGFIGQQGAMSKRRACLTATLFATGILITIAAIGVVTALAGRMLGDIGTVGNYLVAALFFGVGLHLLDVAPMPWSGPGQVGMKRKGLLAALVLGLVFGVALGPCTFAYMAPLLAVTVKLASSYGALLLLAYGLGHCAVIIVAGASTSLVQRYLAWGSASGGTTLLKRLCGVLVLLGGLYMIYIAR